MLNILNDQSIQYTTANDYFTHEEKKLFLQIPHQVTQLDIGQIIDFNVSENGKRSKLSRNSIFITTQPIELEYAQFKNKYGFSLYKYGENIDEPGIHISGDHGQAILYFIESLYVYDPQNAQILFNKYLENATASSDIVEIELRFIDETKKMIEYMKSSNLVLPNLNIDYSQLNSLSKNDLKDKIDSLYKTHPTIKRFPAYNDLDYMPMLINNDYCIHDSSGQRLFIIKEKEDTTQIYYLFLDYKDNPLEQYQLNQHVFEQVEGFYLDYYQHYVDYTKTIEPYELAGEIKDGKLVKASVNLLDFDLIQSYIVKELIKKKKIKIEKVNLNFKQLLENYTKEHELWHIEERAIVPLLAKLKVKKGQLTYEDFSLMSPKIKIKHEEINIYTIEGLPGMKKKQEVAVEPGYRVLDMDDEVNLEHLKKLPIEYKKEISEYLEELLERDNTEHSQLFVNTILLYLDNKPKLKP